MEGTRLRILNTAERLFASDGVEAVTLRSIAAAAGTNVAAVNYYFGTKERLFEEMFLRRLIPMNERRLSMLDTCLAEAKGDTPDLRGIISAFVTPPLETSKDGNKSAQAIVVQFLLGRILAMPAVNQKLAQFYDELRQRFVGALRRALPDLTEGELVWRYYWMGGCVMCSLAIDPAVSAGLVTDRQSAETHAETLIRFFAQWMPRRSTDRSAARRGGEEAAADVSRYAPQRAVTPLLPVRGSVVSGALPDASCARRRGLDPLGKRSFSLCYLLRRSDDPVRDGYRDDDHAAVVADNQRARRDLNAATLDHHVNPQRRKTQLAARRAEIRATEYGITEGRDLRRVAHRPVDHRADGAARLAALRKQCAPGACGAATRNARRRRHPGPIADRPASRDWHRSGRVLHPPGARPAARSAHSPAMRGRVGDSGPMPCIVPETPSWSIASDRLGVGSARSACSQVSDRVIVTRLLNQTLVIDGALVRGRFMPPQTGIPQASYRSSSRVLDGEPPPRRGRRVGYAPLIIRGRSPGSVNCFNRSIEPCFPSCSTGPDGSARNAARRYSRQQQRG